jgi:hypothetical protein
MTSEIRTKLTKDEIYLCRKFFDELIELHDATLPNKKIKQNQYNNALIAINRASYIRETLSGWAENHILGTNLLRHYNPQQYNEDCTSNENILYDEKTKKYLDKDFTKVFRESVSEILEEHSIVDSDWRILIAQGLRALNEGEITTSFKPFKTSNKGNGYSIKNIKLAVINHIYILLGEGWETKEAAYQKLSEEIGVQAGTIKKWHLSAKNESSKVKTQFDAIRIAAKFIKKASEAIADKLNLGDDYGSHLKIEAFSQFISSEECQVENKILVFNSISDVIHFKEKLTFSALAKEVENSGIRKGTKT